MTSYEYLGLLVAWNHEGRREKDLTTTIIGPPDRILDSSYGSGSGEGV